MMKNNQKKQAKVLNPDVIEALKRGEHSAFDTVFDALYYRIYIFLKMLTKSDDDAQELSQRVFIDLWLNREKLDSTKNFNAYIYKMARNSALNFLKSKNLRDFDSYDSLDQESEFNADDDTLVKEIQLLVNLTVSRMPPQRRSVYEMSRNLQKTNDEIADELEITKKAVEKHLRLALSDIRNVLNGFILLLFF